MTTPPDATAYFDSVYRSQPPGTGVLRAAGWDIGKPQEAVAELVRTGALGRRVLDAGCGTGDNALYLATHGHVVTGVDFSEAAVEHARAKAAERGIAAEFRVGDARELAGYEREFDSVIDSGLFHTFYSDADRARYVDALHRVSKPSGTVHILALSDAVPPGPGPRRIGEPEFRAAFATGWVVEQLSPAHMVGTLPGSDTENLVPVWHLTVRRDE